MEFIEFQWLHDESSKKTALQEVLGCSGQLLKKHFSSKDLARAIRARDISKLPLDFVNHQLINPEFQGPRPSIIKETPEYYVLHKPSGVHSHPLCYSDKDTLINFLAQENKWDALNVNSQNYDRGLIYRLDFETSGIMLVARTESFFQSMRSNFKEKMKHKLYLAIVCGDFDKEGSWTHYFKGTGIKGAKQKVEDNPWPDADRGDLTVCKLIHAGDKSLLLVNLASGLRHQIRAQLAALGFPILGDELYGGVAAERLFLHAYKYEWEVSEEDQQADLFDRFFDLNSAFQMSHDVFRVFKGS